MAQNDTGNVAYQRGQELKITKRTVSFRNNVYQFKNITGFSESEIQKEISVPWGYIFIGFIISIISIGPARATGFGIFGFIVCIICIFINISKKDEYGLVLTLNSGDKHMFITRDYAKLSEVIQQLYIFMESDQDDTYVYTINDNSIQIQGDVTGVVASRTKDTTISSNVSHSEDEE